MRMFVAVIPPERVVEDLEEFLAVRRDAGAFRWSRAEQFHVTLAFVPEVAPRVLDDLEERLGAAVARRSPFAARIAGGGAFPDPARAKVLWAGLGLDADATRELDRLATGVRNAANAAGTVVDGQRFRPHLTLARTGRPQPMDNWVRLLDTYAGPPWTADRVELISSHLGEGPQRRPRYETVATYRLGDG